MTEALRAITSKLGVSSDEAYVFVGERLRELRKAKGLTQAEVARVISISPQQYQKYEDAQSRCSLATLILLAEFHGVPIGALLPARVSGGEGSTEAEVIPAEADMMARLVAAFIKLNDTGEKWRLVQLVEAMQTARERIPVE